MIAVAIVLLIALATAGPRPWRWAARAWSAELITLGIVAMLVAGTICVQIGTVDMAADTTRIVEFGLMAAMVAAIGLMWLWFRACRGWFAKP